MIQHSLPTLRGDDGRPQLVYTASSRKPLQLRKLDLAIECQASFFTMVEATSHSLGTRGPLSPSKRILQVN